VRRNQDLVKFRTQINAYGQLYLPKEIREELNTKQIEMLGDARTIVIYAKGLGPAEVLRSLKVVEVDLEHRAELVDKQRGKTA
jgi:bifunctional DNA-binding transcriptional regulator/antitoxin component of YhaV-PrlF toxin-antitoxin module